MEGELGWRGDGPASHDSPGSERRFVCVAEGSFIVPQEGLAVLLFHVCLNVDACNAADVGSLQGIIRDFLGQILFLISVPAFLFVVRS